MTDVTQILSDTEQGDTQVCEQLLPLVYDELWKLAAWKMAQAFGTTKCCFPGGRIRPGRRRRAAMVGSQHRKPGSGPRSRQMGNVR